MFFSWGRVLLSTKVSRQEGLHFQNQSSYLLEDNPPELHLSEVCKDLKTGSIRCLAVSPLGTLENAYWPYHVALCAYFDQRLLTQQDEMLHLTASRLSCQTTDDGKSP
jgi:hypothetical protein